MSLPVEYRENFITQLHNALTGFNGRDIDEAIKFSQQSQTKCVGITIETRPDYCTETHLSDMLKYGCTRLEVGVQSVYEDVARDTNRGHTVKSVCETCSRQGRWLQGSQSYDAGSSKCWYGKRFGAIQGILRKP